MLRPELFQVVAALIIASISAPTRYMMKAKKS